MQNNQLQNTNETQRALHPLRIRTVGTIAAIVSVIIAFAALIMLARVSDAFNVAMGNGGVEVKEAADYITDDVNEDGLYNAFKYLNLF